MSSRAPGAGSRGRGGKFRKFTRGGGKQFSRNLQPVDDEGNAVSMWSEEAQNKASDDDASDSDNESGDEPTETAAAAGPSADASREDRKAQKKARKDAAKAKSHKVEVGDMPSSDSDSDESDGHGHGNAPANPNHSTAARKQTSQPAATVDDITEGVKKMPANRREREAAEAAAAKERYMRLSAQGKTDTAKADLARLRLIREQREAEAARRQAEKEEKDDQDARRREEIEAREAKRREAAAGPKKPAKKK